MKVPEGIELIATSRSGEGVGGPGLLALDLADADACRAGAQWRRLHRCGQGRKRARAGPGRERRRAAGLRGSGGGDGRAAKWSGGAVAAIYFQGKLLLLMGSCSWISGSIKELNRDDADRTGAAERSGGHGCAGDLRSALARRRRWGRSGDVIDSPVAQFPIPSSPCCAAPPGSQRPSAGLQRRWWHTFR
jgi:hypothetical protein